MARPPAFIDHIIIQVADLSRSLEFYRAALKPLGAEVTDVPGPPESSWGPAVVLGPPDAEDLARPSFELVRLPHPPGEDE